MNTSIIAHRGASYLAEHENTIEAFKIAIDLKSDYAEFDIRRTRDKKLIVFHDDIINSTSISYLTYDDILEITHKEGYEVPLLEDVLKFCKGKIKLDIELKESGYEKLVIDMVTSSYNYNDFMIKSFIDKAVYRVNQLDSNITTGLLLGLKKNTLGGRLSEYFPMKRVRRCKASFVSPYYKLCTRCFIFRMKKQKLKIYPWTVNQPKIISKLLKYKVDGIITDRPDAALFHKKEYTI